MATAGEVGKALSGISGKPLVSVMTMGRVLREEGHVAIKGRGKSAHNLSIAEVAKWLVASTCSDSVYGAAKTVDAVWKTRGAGKALVEHLENPVSDLEIVYRPVVRVVMWRDLQPVQYGEIGDSVGCYYLVMIRRRDLEDLRDMVVAA